MNLVASKRLSCGVVIVNPHRELLLCHVTGHDHWDLPKGGRNPGETPLQAALRETTEETGLHLSPRALLELGRFAFSAKSDLHLYATLMPRIDVADLFCGSHFHERGSDRHLPEMDGYGWFSFERIAAQCLPRLAGLLSRALQLDRVLDRLIAEQQWPAAA
jgi:8-oxo-dGTP pyrophosphatase MutT (NUDIX family)